MKRILIASASALLLVASACAGSGDTDARNPGTGGGAGSAGSSGGKAGAAGSAGSAGSSAGSGGANAGGSNIGGSNAGGANAGGSNTGGSNTGGSFACGSETCGANQYCINPCCGGAPQPCFNRGDAGMCPAGSVQGCNYPSEVCPDVAFCCRPLPCEPPPPYCADELPIGCLVQGRNCLMLCA